MSQFLHTTPRRHHLGGRRVRVNSHRHLPARLLRQCLHRKRLCCACHDCIILRLGRAEAPATLSTRPALDDYPSNDHQASGCALALLPVRGPIRVHIHVLVDTNESHKGKQRCCTSAVLKARSQPKSSLRTRARSLDHVQEERDQAKVDLAEQC